MAISKPSPRRWRALGVSFFSADSRNHEAPGGKNPGRSEERRFPGASGAATRLRHMKEQAVAARFPAGEASRGPGTPQNSPVQPAGSPLCLFVWPKPFEVAGESRRPSRHPFIGPLNAAV